MNESTNKACCGFFIDTLNRVTNSQSVVRLSGCFRSSQSQQQVEQEFVINDDLSLSDVDNFLNYCNLWQQKQCMCIFTKDDLFEKFHHFLHQIIAMSVLVIKNLGDKCTDGGETGLQVLKSSMEFKEKLLGCLLKVFSLNMPLYLTYKHLLNNSHGRYSRLPDCSCCNLSQDSLNLIQIYCTTSQDSSPANKPLNQDLDNLPVEFLRNICHFVDLYGLVAIKQCFDSDQSVHLPLSLVHILFNLIVNIRVWLNPSFVEQQILSIRPLAIKYMCNLCDKDLRLAGNRNTIELMNESFKLPNLNSYINQTSDSSQSSSSSEQTSQENCTFEFKIDLDGLTLAHKYLTSNTLTIRLYGVAQMSLQINAWSEFNSLNASNLRTKALKNELADWFVQNSIIEYLYGPNLHHELIKRSQDIVNFLAFTNRLTEKHLDVIWASAQLKYCSKSAMETLISLIKHLDINSVKYLSKLISKLDLEKQTDQTLFLSALLTKNQWSLMLELGDVRRMLKSESDLSQGSVCLKNPRAPTSSSDEDDDKVKTKRLRQRRETVNSFVNNVDENEESEDEDYEESEEEDESEDSEHESEDTEDLDIEVERVNSGFRPTIGDERNENCDSSQDGLNQELMRISRLNELNQFKNGSRDEDEDLNSHSSNGSKALSAKNFNDLDQESEDNGTADEESDYAQNLNMASSINSLGANLMVQRCRLPSTPSNEEEMNSSESTGLNLNDLTEPGNTFLWDLLTNQQGDQMSETYLKLLKEAEKQFQLIICHLTTDRRIKFKFIESCIKYIHVPHICPIALRLLTKIFSSFQQYKGNAFNFLTEFRKAKKLNATRPITDMHKTLFLSVQSGNSHPANEIHKIVALTDLKFNLIDQFFLSLKSLEQSKDQHMQVQTRLQFLSFIYSTIGSLPGFYLSAQNVDDLWSCLVKFDQSTEIKDDIFNWFLIQAKNKDQHAVSVNSFKLIFEQKMPLLEPNNFSLSALHLYQELFKIYKSTSQESHDMKLMEQSAIDYILKLAFKSQLNEVSLSAVQFLNSHHTNNEGEFIEKCLEYLKKSRQCLEESDCVETSLIEIQRGLLLLKNHLDLSQRKNSYRIRLMQIKEPKYLNHSKSLVNYESCLADGLIRFVCHVNSTRFNFELVMTLSDCVGDLKAVVREILLNCIKSGKDMNGNEGGQQVMDNDGYENENDKLVFNPNNLNSMDLCKKAYLNLIQGNQNTEMFKQIHTLIEKEDVLYIKLFSNGQELTTESKLLSELGLKDYQAIHVGLFSKSFLNQTNMPTRLEPESLPIVILSREENFKSMFKLLNLLAHMSGQDFEPLVKKKICHLSQKCWKIINTLPSSESLLASIKDSKDFNLSELHQDLLETEQYNLPKSIGFDRPYQLLYYTQLIEITFSQSDLHTDKKLVTCAKYIYKIALLLANYLSNKASNESSKMLKFEVKLDCMNIFLNLLNRCLLDVAPCVSLDHGESPRKKLKKNAPLLDKLNYHPSQVRLELFSTIFCPNTMISFLLKVQSFSSLSQSDSSLNLLGQSMKLLVDSLASECNFAIMLRSSLVEANLHQHRLNWLKSLLMSAKSDLYRKEAATWLHRLCLVDDSVLAVILPELIDLINLTSKYSPADDDMACKEYFILITDLVSVNTKLINFSQLMRFINHGLESRDIFEIASANNPTYLEDHFLVGLLSLGCSLVKNRLVDQQVDEGLVDKLIDYLFSTRDDMYPRVVLPKLRSGRSRELAFDFLLELCKFKPDNYHLVVNRLMRLHDATSMLVWDYWPREEVRSIYGYLGLVNLGATCYMATSLQHLFMIKEARQLILESNMSQAQAGQYDNILAELKKIFAFLQESERKSYSPKDLCKVYTMDQQVVNTGEQKDMQEFFTDLISKLEETSDPKIKTEIKKLFGGVITNVVISLDCPHVSSSLEEFYTVRCQVAGMRDLYESLNEITVKDTLDGDNMYTCSTCFKKVRAEKRACFKQLPDVLCLNTMRYTFNMVTMLKEKVNTYFSFPLELNMSGYMEQNLIDSDTNIVCAASDDFVYDLIGVTVHTGTADGGHYYSFIQEAAEGSPKPKWFLFNDAEVKQFDVETQLAADCFGGETTSKTYDSHNDKFTDLSFEKNNSAYMLFYKKRYTHSHPSVISTKCNDQALLSQIWTDNLQFITDRLIFETAYFNFVFELGHLALSSPTLGLHGAQLTITFFLETFIHSREKHNMHQWIDLLGKLFAHEQTCDWLLDRLGSRLDCVRKILIKCPQVSIRSSFQKFLLSIAHKCDQSQVDRFLGGYLSLLGETNPIRYMSEYFTFLTEYSRLGEHQNLSLLANDLVKHLCTFYLRNRRTDSTKSPSVDSDNSDFSVDNIDSDSDSDNDIIALNEQRTKPKVFEKLLALLVQLTGSHLLHVHKNYKLKQIKLVKVPMSFFNKSVQDGLSVTGLKQLLINVIRLRSDLAAESPRVYVQKFLNMCVKSIGQLGKKCSDPDKYMNFFAMVNCLLSLEAERVCPDEIECTLCESDTTLLQDYSGMVTESLSDMFKLAPYYTLRWLTGVANAHIELWLLDNMAEWVRPLLIDAKQTQVRLSAAVLLVHLVPDGDFRHEFTTNRNMLVPYSAEPAQLTEAFRRTVDKIVRHLVSLLSAEPAEWALLDTELFHTTNLIQFFTVLIYFMLGGEQKRLVVQGDSLQLFWERIFFKHMANSHVTTNLNKQVMSHFVYHCLNECAEVLDYVTEYADKFVHSMAVELPLCTVMVDHEDIELISYNKQCLHPFYASIRLLCQHSPRYLSHMCQHSNLQWAFKHVLPHSVHYASACAELVKLADMLGRESPELKERLCGQFSMSTAVEPKHSFQSIVWLMRAIVRDNDDATMLLTRRGLSTLSQCLFQLVIAINTNPYNHDTHVQDLNDCLILLNTLMHSVRRHTDAKTDGIQQILATWKEKFELIKRLVVLINFSVPTSTRSHAIELVRLVLENNPIEMTVNTLAVLKQCHTSLNYHQTCQSYQKGSILSVKPTVNPLQKCLMSNQSINQACSLMGGYFPVPSSASLGSKRLKAVFNLYLPLGLVNHCHYDGCVFMVSKIVGHLSEYEKSLRDAFMPWFNFCHFIFKLAIENSASLSEQNTKNLIDLVLIVAAQSVFFNTHFISYLTERRADWADLIAESAHLGHFVRMLMSDYRHLVAREDYAAFLAAFVRRFMRSQVPRNSLAMTESFSSLLSQPIKNIIRLCLSSINEIRFYFDFSADKLAEETGHHLDMKRSCVLGSIKCVQLIIHSVSECKFDKQFVKFVKQLKDFFVSYWEHVGKQSELMCKYMDDEGHRSKKVKLDEAEGGEARARLEAKQKSVSAMLDALAENIELMNGLIEGLDAMQDESTDETSDETSSSSSSSHEASTESGTNNEQESTSEQEQSNA